MVRVICMLASCPSYLANRTPIAQGAINTIAGAGTQAYGGDGTPASSADVEWVNGVATDGANDVFLSQGINAAPYVREVTTPVTVQAYPTPLHPSFANQQVGTTSGAQTVTFTNPTSSSISVSSVAFSGANAGDFTIASGGDHSSGTAVAAGAAARCR